MSQVATGQLAPGTPRRRVRIGTVEIDPVTLAEAIDSIESLVDAGVGGSVFTPNVDHLVLAEANPRLREAYARTSLSLVDGTWVLWASGFWRSPTGEGFRFGPDAPADAACRRQGVDGRPAGRAARGGR